MCTTALRWIVFVLVWQMSKLYVLKQSLTVVCDVCFQIDGISYLYLCVVGMCVLPYIHIRVQ